MSSARVVAAGMLVYRRVTGVVEYLFLQASYPPYHWTPPKGHIEWDQGEDEYAGALRETCEEAGITEDRLDVHKDVSYEMSYLANGKPKKVKYWLAHLRDDKDIKLSDEHTHWKWLQLADAIETSKFPEIEKMLREAENYLSQH
uniref:Bis(5'-nucleosyl)-tetraphosphatase [asymmetrical] n=1 Tax=Steinernema glaseri TaxID=37863 RepID=A0A1I7ZDS0_9BILA